MKQIAISAENITKVYSNGKIALKNLSCDLFYGQLVGLIGSNGAGKSTLIHILTGVIKQTDGKVNRFLDNQHEISWVSQFSSIDWYLSVLDNIRLGARLGGCTFNEAKTISKKCLSIVGLENKEHQSPDTLSGGEQRRLQVARALAQKTKILILDEPTTGLDPVASQIVMEELRKQADQGCLVIVSSHDIGLVESLADHILFLSDGELQVNDTKAKVLPKTKNGLKDLYFQFSKNE